MYRLVADYGHGDKSWCERFMNEEEALAVIRKERPGVENLEQAMDGMIYYLEEDDFEDEEDWDWMDS
jgi:hypothetical protein